ncbi:TetR/AcrR family transcriptional regulator [Rathayibacter sp. VKM Ac-2630]|uniref:TetR/AcrR family transcriptional regulator n=1 Tax=Rathayibacter sp. VKM Ac-2630 TaxID=1938617 RepID=UPI0013011925|nr:TetR/AcrR family transcriptional regulator [Rathayibacter sp. VKM Ac-2630]
MSRSERGYHHGDLASALERAAFELIDESGHAKVSLREVARRADVSHNAPYHHYGDRAALLAHLGAVAMEELLEDLESALRSADPADAPARAVRVASAYIENAARHPARFRLVNDPDICDLREPSPTMAPLLDRVHGILAQVVDELDPATAPPLQAALRTALWGAVHGLAELVVTGQVNQTDTEPALQALLSRGEFGREK